MQRSRIPLWLGWGLACVFLGTTVLLMWRQSRPTPGVTDENLQKIKSGMSLQEVERILGPGKPGRGPLSATPVDEGLKSADWKYWINPKSPKENWESAFVCAFVDDRLTSDWVTTGTIKGEPNRSIKQVFSIDKLLQPDMGEDRLIYEYRGGFIDCWVEVVIDGKKEVVGLISSRQLRKKGQKLRADEENDVHGQILWNPTSSGPKDLTLLVTATADEQQGLGTTIGLQRGMNRLVKEKWPKLWNEKEWSSFHGPETSTLTPGEEKLLFAYQSPGGERRLMCKLVVGSE
jgi:hypothetical protein